jgi:hypothetical protein
MNGVTALGCTDGRGGTARHPQVDTQLSRICMFPVVFVTILRVTVKFRRERISICMFWQDLHLVMQPPVAQSGVHIFKQRSEGNACTGMRMILTHCRKVYVYLQITA